jgi:hypothetical protein
MEAESCNNQEGHGMLKKLALFMGAAILAVGVSAVGTGADAQGGGVRAGVLTCYVDSGWGFVFGSSHNVRCNFRPNEQHGEHYAGSISKFGVDIGYQEGGVIVWAVLAPTGTLAPGSLAGTYVGATAGATVGVGAAANALIGGSGNSITLQPVSLEGMQGVNVAAGIGAISLSYQP